MGLRQWARVEWWVLFAAYVGAALMCGYGVLLFLASFMKLPDGRYGGLILAGLFGAMMILCSLSNSRRNRRRRYARRLRAWSAERSDCPQCGYELAGSGGRRCPECGGWKGRMSVAERPPD